MAERSTTGLEQNIAGALCYLLGFVTGILFYLVEKQNDFVRFHAIQSTLVFGGLFAFSLVLGALSTAVFPVPGIGALLAAVFGTISLLISPISFILWLFLMYTAYSNDRYALPWIGRYAERFV